MDEKLGYPFLIRKVNQLWRELASDFPILEKSGIAEFTGIYAN